MLVYEETFVAMFLSVLSAVFTTGAGGTVVVFSVCVFTAVPLGSSWVFSVFSVEYFLLVPLPVLLFLSIL